MKIGGQHSYNNLIQIFKFYQISIIICKKKKKKKKKHENFRSFVLFCEEKERSVVNKTHVLLSCILMHDHLANSLYWEGTIKPP